MNLYIHGEQNQKKLDFKIGVLRVQEPDLTPVSAVQDPLLSVIRAWLWQHTWTAAAERVTR